MLELDAVRQSEVEDIDENKVVLRQEADSRPRLVQSALRLQTLLVDAVREWTRGQRMIGGDDGILSVSVAAEVFGVRAFDVVADQNDRLADEPRQREERSRMRL